MPGLRTCVGAALAGVVVVGCCLGLTASSASGGSARTADGADPRPNIVLVLTDDLSRNLVRYMPSVQALQRRGMTFTNYSVSNSLCCPSRATILTGEFPQNTGVLSNTAPTGGYTAFQARRDQRHTFAVTLARAGYRTGFFGKYLNGYRPVDEPQNPAGWSDWGGVDGRGYAEYGYNMSVNGTVVHHGDRPGDYLTTVLDRMGRQFISSAAAGGTPFALEIATFTPHSPYVPAPADQGTFLHLRVPRTPAFDTHPANAPPWLADRPLLTPRQIWRAKQVFRKRVRCVQSVDRMLGHLQATLRSVHELANTVFVFSSDNGLHIGEHGLTAGKTTAFDTDVRVPLVMAGPGIAPGSTNADLVGNVDLAPTFARLAGARFNNTLVDGHSFEPLLHGRDLPWRTLAPVEHFRVPEGTGDPDRQPTSAGRVPSYNALRSTTFTYVEYTDGARVYYDRSRDPYQLDNIYGTLPPRRVATLHRELTAMTQCRGYTRCWLAAAPTG